MPCIISGIFRRLGMECTALITDSISELDILVAENNSCIVKRSFIQSNIIPSS